MPIVPDAKSDMNGVVATQNPDRAAGTTTSSARVFGLVLLLTLPVYLATATYQRPWHIDALTNAVTAWSFGMTGSPLLPSHEEALEPGQFGNVGWIVDSPEGPVSQYPPGAALAAAPLYAAWNQPLEPAMIRGSNRPDLSAISFPVPNLVPAALTAAVATSLAVAFIGASMAALGASARAAVITALVSAFATGHWSVSSNQLWQHGPASALVSAAAYAAIVRRPTLAGSLLGAAILVRPHLAVMAAVLGLWLGWSRRSVRPVIAVGGPAAVGLGLLLWFNWSVWGVLSISGGYGTAFTDEFLGNGIGWYLRNILGAVVDPRHGLLTASPFLIFLVPGLRTAWRSTSSEVRALAVGGLLYLLIQLRANRFSGGDGHFGYRYPLEALTVAAPLLASSFVLYCSKLGERSRFARYFVFAVVVSVIPQGIWAVLR